MLLPAIGILILAQAQGGWAPTQENPLARAALDVFASKCVQCHGSDLPHPRARFGFVTDLERLVASEKYVVPGNLDESELWQEIAEGDMPPSEAKAGPLTPDQADAIRQWILAGAPPLQDSEPMTLVQANRTIMLPSHVEKPAEAAATPHEQMESYPRRLVALIGRLHVLVIHFPIALLVVAALCEAWQALRGSERVAPSVRLCLSLGALAAPVAAGMGWIHALDGFAGPLSDPTSVLGLHRWLGTGAGVIAPAIALLSERDARRGRRSFGVRMAIMALALAVGGAGHFGGILTHGSGLLDL
jgi:mono/diheme cytochrome c family protein/uncharacterized membrane protein